MNNKRSNSLHNSFAFVLRPRLRSKDQSDAIVKWVTSFNINVYLCFILFSSYYKWTIQLYTGHDSHDKILGVGFIIFFSNFRGTIYKIHSKNKFFNHCSYKRTLNSANVAHNKQCQWCICFSFCRDDTIQPTDFKF